MEVIFCNIHQKHPLFIGPQNAHNQRTAIVRFSYAAQQEDELDLKEGDELEVFEDVEDGWARGQIVGHVNIGGGGGATDGMGKVGLFPTNFVSFASELPNTNTCKWV